MHACEKGVVLGQWRLLIGEVIRLASFDELPGVQHSMEMPLFSSLPAGREIEETGGVNENMV